MWVCKGIIYRAPSDERREECSARTAVGCMALSLCYMQTDSGLFAPL